MNLKPPFDDEQVDLAIRSYLAARGSRVDTRRILAELQQRIEREVPPAVATTPRVVADRPRRNGRRVALAAGVLLAAGLIVYAILPRREISAASLISEAHTVLEKNRDRCYRIDIDVPRGWARRFPVLVGQTEVALCTRGRQFRLVSTRPDNAFTWGRDAKGQMWIVRGDKALTLQRDEVPQVMRKASAMLPFNVGQLLLGFLARFDLQYERFFERDGVRFAVIHATARPEVKGPINEARLEIDLASHTIRRMELMHSAKGTPQGKLTFTLVDDGAKANSTYRLSGNIGPEVEVYDRQRPDERTLLRELFGQ